MAVWPPSLPCIMLGASESQQEGVIRSDMSTGPQKVRPRFTAVSRFVSATLTLDATQRGTMDTFFTDTLSGGALTFDLDDPFGGALVSARFMAPISYVYVGKDGAQARWYNATITLEILP